MKRETTTDRQGFIFYHSFYKAIKTLPKENQLEVYNAIFEYSLNGIIQKLDGISSTIFELILPQLKASFIKYENGKKGGRPPSNKKPKQNPNETKTKPKQNPNETNTNINTNINTNKEFSLTPEQCEEMRKKYPEYEKRGYTNYHIECEERFKLTGSYT